MAVTSKQARSAPVLASRKQARDAPVLAGAMAGYQPPGPVAAAFLESDAFVCAIRGPLGSGKSTACVAKLLQNTRNQVPLKDGWIRRRSAVIRNTYVIIASTTDGTWVNGRFQIPRGMVKAIKPLRRKRRIQQKGSVIAISGAG